MITIGQLADYAGVTIKAVRHYHRRGLLDGAAARLVGLPALQRPARHRAGQDQDARRGRRAARPHQGAARRRPRPVRRRDRRDRPQPAGTGRGDPPHPRADRPAHAGDRLFVSAEVADYLDRLHELGVSQRTVQMERDIWILMQSVSPNEAAAWIADKLDAIGDPEFRAIYLEYDAAFDWSPDDPRLYALADRTRRWIANRHGRSEGGAAVGPGSGHRPAGRDVGRRVVAGLGPAHRDRQ